MNINSFLINNIQSKVYFIRLEWISSKSFVCFWLSLYFFLFIENASSAKIIKNERTIKIIVIKRASENPKKERSLKVIRAPNMTIAHDAPSKKLIILSNLSSCIRESLLVVVNSDSTTKVNICKHHEDKRL